MDLTTFPKGRRAAGRGHHHGRITNCERKISGQSTWDQAKLWCEDVLASIPSEQARAQAYVPARSPLTREQTLALMDHIGACDKLLNGD